MMPRHRADALSSADSPTRGGGFLFDLETPRPGLRLLQRWMGIRKLCDLYAVAEERQNSGRDPSMFQSLLSALDVRWDISSADRQRIPASGPVLVVANHPFGMVDALLIGALLRTLRPDVRIMANFLLERFPAAKDHLILVNPFGSKGACHSNRHGLRQSLFWLKGGGALVIFPAGEVSSFLPDRRTVADPVWSESVARLAVLSKAPVLPMFIDGRNGLGFQVAGLLHPRLRTALLVRELLNKSGKTVLLRAGGVVPAKKLAGFATDQARIGYLRRKTYVLADRQDTYAGLPALSVPPGKEPILGPTEPSRMEEEIACLAGSALLFRQGDFQVYIAAANSIPHIVREIGRLREITFRQTGEGTGKSIDLDEFDTHYLHLFVWNQAEREIVGAYRVGQSDVILRNLGLRGLYTRKLFAYQRQFLERITPALELGRSFVCHKYQRTYHALLLLWRGIGVYVCRNPHYRMLFGPVSISNDYHPGSQQLIVKFLKEYCRAADLAKFVRARSPFRTRSLRGWDGGAEAGIAWDIEELSATIADIEVDGKGVPVLLRQYLKLGGKLVSFNVDSSFSNALDGLIVVDLLQSDRKLLERYMGESGLELFLDYHCRQLSQAR